MDENFQDLLADNFEAILDSLVENDIVKEIPVLGTSLKMIRGIQSIRDRAYLNKIKTFLDNVGEITDEQKQKLIKEIEKTKNSRAKFGDALFTAIEQSDSQVKIEYISVAFLAFLNNEIGDWELKLLNHMIRITFTDELLDVVENEKPSIELKYLASTGLVDIEYPKLTYDGNAEPIYNLSPYAKSLRKIWRKYKR